MDRGAFLEIIGMGLVASKVEIWLARKEVWLNKSWLGEGKGWAHSFVTSEPLQKDLFPCFRDKPPLLWNLPPKNS